MAIKHFRKEEKGFCMILDNEQQRQDLLQVIAATVINGPFGQIGNTIAALNDLEEKVKTATISVISEKDNKYKSILERTGG